MKKIAIFTSGGDAPGMNACIRAAVRGAISEGYEAYGIIRGYDGMIKGDIHRMHSYSVSNIIQKGGTVLKSARSSEFRTKEGRQKAFEQLQKIGIDGLVAIGGDGTFTGAKIFYEEFGIPTVGAPGTIDNDLFGTDYTIGFDTAINTAMEAIDKIRDTADSHDRLFFIEVMGRDSGYIAIACAVAGGAEVVMVPETITTMEEVEAALKFGYKNSKTSSVVIVAEGDEEGNATEVAEKIKKMIPDVFDIRVSTLGHIQRGGSPTARDRILASRLGMGAILGLKEGRKSEMIGIINNQICYTSFEESITKTKSINHELLHLINTLSI